MSALELSLTSLSREARSLFSLLRDVRAAHSVFFRALLRASNILSAPADPLTSGLDSAVGELILLLESTSRSPSACRRSVRALVKWLESRIEGSRSFLILCDALGLPEFLSLAYHFERGLHSVAPGGAVNPGGKTGTFKLLVYKIFSKPFTLEEATLEGAGSLLRGRVGFSDFLVFRGIDEAVHSSSFMGFSDPDRLEEHLYAPLDDLISLADDLLKKCPTLVILGDHGYDVEVKGGVWAACHRWPGASCLIPALLIRRGGGE